MSKNLNKSWVHPADTLLKGHIVYTVKFLGHVQVQVPKGTDVVKEAIRKMKFNKQIKRAEGQKPSKVELTISADGITIQDLKTKEIQHQYALHRISYCADDKSDKKMLTFIAKDATTDTHSCFVLSSDKCAEEITLTIGQAFDLAYRRFLDTSGKDFDQKKQCLMLQKKVQELTEENEMLKRRINDLEQLKDRDSVNHYKQQNSQDDLISIQSTVAPPTIPPRTAAATTPLAHSNPEPVVGRRLENLMFSDSPSTPQTNGIHSVSSPPPIAPPPSSGRGHRSSPHLNPSTRPRSPAQAVDDFGAKPFNSPAAAEDPFGMGSFNPSSTPHDIDRQLLEMNDIQAGFSQGLAFGTSEFSLAELDPLNHT